MSRFVRKGGERLCVIRPQDPKLALELSMKATEANDQEAFNAVLGAQHYVYQGFLGFGHKDEAPILDKDGKRIGTLVPGDSFVRESQMAQFKIVGSA